MHIKDIRLRNMNKLIEECGSLNQFCEITGITQSYISQIRSEKSEKNVGDKTADTIEKAFGKDRGWMDTINDNKEHASLTDFDALEEAVKTIINQLIMAKVYKQIQPMSTEVFASLIVAEYKKIYADAQSEAGNNNV